jgi:hypothetical protein
MVKALVVLAALLIQSEVSGTIVRSLKFENFKGVSASEAMNRLKDRGVRIAVEQFYEPSQVEPARQVLQELLEEKGHKQEVQSSVKQIPPRSVELVFKAVKN